MRTITIVDKTLRQLLQKRGEIVLAGRKEDEERQKLQDQTEAIMQSLNKKALELQKIDGKATEIINKKKIELIKDGKVWEVIKGASLDGEKINIQIIDKVEEYVENLKAPKEDKKEEKKK